MAQSNREAWRQVAGYRYLLHLDAPSMAWEYLRRHPDYRREWSEHQHQPRMPRKWGLRMFEDPSLDGREAAPIWCADLDHALQLHCDPDPPTRAAAFSFWQIPGRRQLVHQGKCLTLLARSPVSALRVNLSVELEEGGPYLVALRTVAGGRATGRRLATAIEKLALDGRARLAGCVRPRPSAAALLQMRALQVLDARLAGVTQRQIAIGLFGIQEVAAGWHADGVLRLRLRRLIRHGRRLMHGGYRSLLGPG